MSWIGKMFNEGGTGSPSQSHVTIINSTISLKLHDNPCFTNELETAQKAFDFTKPPDSWLES